MKYYVYPGHGVGEVIKEETKEILGHKVEFIHLKILDTGLKIMVPIHAMSTLGVRKLMSESEAKQCVEIVTTGLIESHNQSWSQRYREYMEKIKSGNPIDIARVMASLKTLKVEKELSFGERKMLDCARSMLIREIDVVLGREVALKLVD